MCRGTGHGHRRTGEGDFDGGSANAGAVGEAAGIGTKTVRYARALFRGQDRSFWMENAHQGFGAVTRDRGCVVAVFGVCKAETRSRLADSYRHGLVTRPPRACG